jgi:hypothetical protein
MHPDIGKHIAPGFLDRELSLDLELHPFEQDTGDADATVPPPETVSFDTELVLQAHVRLDARVQVHSREVAQAQ